MSNTRTGSRMPPVAFVGHDAEILAGAIDSSTGALVHR
jgi:hypothetical protein